MFWPSIFEGMQLEGSASLFVCVSSKDFNQPRCYDLDSFQMVGGLNRIYSRCGLNDKLYRSTKMSFVLWLYSSDKASLKSGGPTVDMCWLLLEIIEKSHLRGQRRA